MFEQDYLMRIIAQLMGAIRRSMERAAGEEDPDGAARMLDMAVGEATDLDGEDLIGHYSESKMSCFKNLIEGDAVTFEVTEGQNGKLQASNVERL